MTLVDGTVGAGGHAARLAKQVGSEGKIIGLDRDPAMLALAATATRDLPVQLLQASYDDWEEVRIELGLGLIDGIVLDLGLSSDQLAWAERGFSFNTNGPLDMRFDPGAEVTAAELVNTLSEVKLANLIYEFGEERHSRRIAARIVEQRRLGPIRTTADLAAIVRRAIPGKWGPIDPATRTFQALRIAVNRELERLDHFLNQAASWLNPGGRLAIVSFHSLEDRRVKLAFRSNPDLVVLTKKPVMASEAEVRLNPRARSAKLRVAERCIQQHQIPSPNPRRPS